LSLLESEADPSPAAQERVALLGFDPACRYRAAIVLVPEEIPLGREGFLRRDAVAQNVRTFLKADGAGQLVSMVLDRVPVLVPESLNLDALLRSLGDESLSIVAGRAYAGAAGVRASYREAVSLVSYSNRKAVCNFDDVLVPRVIGGDRDARRTFVDDVLVPLRSQRGGEALAEAVLGLARHGFRMRETADTLNIHPNTLRYRLNRASEVLGVRFDDPDVRFELQLAARIVEFDR
jgi:purine catabolism regulator